MIRPVLTPEEGHATIIALRAMVANTEHSGVRFVGADLEHLVGAREAVEAAQRGPSETSAFEALGVVSRERSVWDPGSVA